MSCHQEQVKGKDKNGEGEELVKAGTLLLFGWRQEPDQEAGEFGLLELLLV